jgi:hypothetical protein
MVSDSILMDHGLEDPHLSLTQIDLPALESVVHLFGDAEKIRRPMDYPPTGLDAGAVHQERQGGQQRCRAAAAIGRIYMDHMEMLEQPGFLSDPLNRPGTYELLIIFQLREFLKTHDLSPLSSSYSSIKQTSIALSLPASAYFNFLLFD